MRRVIDCHVHLYPPEVFADARAWGTAHHERWWTQCVDPPGRQTLQGWADVGQLLRDMDRAGVEQAALMGWYWQRQETCDLQNGWYRTWVEDHPDRLLAFAAVQPAAGRSALDATRRSLDAGFCGLGEFLPQAQGFTFADESWARLTALAAEYGVPVNLHVTNPLLNTRNATNLPTPLEEYVQLVKDFPQTTFILAHWGGGLPLLYEFQPGLKKHFARVYFDTSASSLIYTKEIFRRVLDMVSAERVLFGTDYPLLCYPRESRTPDLARPLADASSAGLTEAEMDLVLGGNLRRLLRRA